MNHGKAILRRIKEKRNPKTGWTNFADLAKFGKDIRKKLKVMADEDLVIIMGREVKFKNEVVAEIV